MAFNNDGTKMYVIGNSGDEVNEYNLSTAFDVSTRSYVQNFSVATQETNPTGITFNNDGTKMFIIGRNNDKVVQYSLSTAFDISTANFVQDFSVSGQQTSPQAVIFNNDGTKMFTVCDGDDEVNEYNLSIAFNITTLSFVQNFSLAAHETSPTGIRFNNDGTKMFIIGYDGDDVNEYTLSSAFDAVSYTHLRAHET